MAAARNQHFIIHIKAQCCWCKENLHSALNTGSSTVWCHVSNPFIYLPSGLSAQSCSEEGAGGCWARQRRVCRARRRLYRWCNGSDRRASVCFYRWHSWNTAGSSKASGQTWKRKKSLKHINIRWKHRIWAYLLVQEADPWSKGWIIIKILSITVESVPLKLSNKKFESEYMCLRLVKKKKKGWFLSLLILWGHIFPCHCLSPPNPRCFCQTSSGRWSAPMWELGIYLEVVNISLCPHHHFVGWDRLAAGAARPAVPEQSANTKTQIAQSVQLPKSKSSSFLSSPSFLSTQDLTWCSRSDTESCPLCCSRWCQCPPAGLGSKSTWGSECASSAPWRRAGSGRQSSPRILHTTWGPVVRLTLGCSPYWCGPSAAPGHTRERFGRWDKCNS